MTADRPPGKTSSRTSPPAAAQPARRHPFGPRAIGAVLPGVLRPAFRSGGAVAAQLLADWPAIVGPLLAVTTLPKRLVAGTLTLGCAGPVALELQHFAPQLIERINTHLGRTPVHRLRFIQDGAPPRPAPAAAARRATTPVPIDAFPDGPLRDALAALGGAVHGDRR